MNNVLEFTPENFPAFFDIIEVPAPGGMKCAKVKRVGVGLDDDITDLIEELYKEARPDELLPGPGNKIDPAKMQAWWTIAIRTDRKAKERFARIIFFPVKDGPPFDIFYKVLPWEIFAEAYNFLPESSSLTENELPQFDESFENSSITTETPSGNQVEPQESLTASM